MENKTFNRWTVIDVYGKRNGHTLWFAKCKCGTSKIVFAQNLIRGLSKSCGCWNLEVCKTRTSKAFSRCRTYRIWSGLLTRCRNKKALSYKDYGGRGIDICDSWRNYENFLADMGHVPDGLQIDRINNDGNYEPGNCRWTDKFVNANNVRTNRIVFYEGKRQTMAQWCRELSLPYRLTIQRLDRDHWSLTRAFEGNKKEKQK